MIRGIRSEVKRKQIVGCGSSDIFIHEYLAYIYASCRAFVVYDLYT
jgi:hypothetical protein